MTDAKHIVHELLEGHPFPQAIDRAAERIAALEAEIINVQEHERIIAARDALTVKAIAAHRDQIMGECDKLTAELAETRKIVGPGAWSCHPGLEPPDLRHAPGIPDLVTLTAERDEAVAQRDALARLRDFDTGVLPLPAGLALEHARLDRLWQTLVVERDALKTERDAEYKLAYELAKERDALQAKHDALLYQYKACHEEKDALALALQAYVNAHDCVPAECVKCDDARNALTTPGAARVLRELEALRALVSLVQEAIAQDMIHHVAAPILAEALAAVEQARNPPSKEKGD